MNEGSLVRLVGWITAPVHIGLNVLAAAWYVIRLEVNARRR